MRRGHFNLVGIGMYLTNNQGKKGGVANFSMTVKIRAKWVDCHRIELEPSSFA